MSSKNNGDEQRSGRLSKADRRRQLLDTAMRIVREEGADRLTLGHLAVRAGVSKPVAYDHFQTRAGLLIELYRWIDTERVTAFRAMMAEGERTPQDTIATLADVYIACASNCEDEFHAVGAALAGSGEKAAVYQDLQDNVVKMFEAVLQPITSLADAKLTQVCIGLVGAGDALSSAVGRGKCSAAEAKASLAALLWAALEPSGQEGESG